MFLDLNFVQSTSDSCNRTRIKLSVLLFKKCFYFPARKKGDIKMYYLNVESLRCNVF